MRALRAVYRGATFAVPYRVDSTGRHSPRAEMTTPVPLEIRTMRLVLRPWRASDAAALSPILRANVDHLSRWIPREVATPAPLPELAERLSRFAADFAEGRAWRYAVLAADDGRPLGEADLFSRDASHRVAYPGGDRLELGYWLDAAATGRGVATEAARALLAVAAALPGERLVEIRCDAANAASAAVPRRLGFELGAVEGELQIWRGPAAEASAHA